MRCIFLLLIITTAYVINAPSALALRPFVTTDADVAEPFEVELEIGVTGFTMEKQPGPDEVRIQSPPSMRFNLGFPGDWEVVLETIHEFIDKKNHGGLESDINQFTATAGSVKKVWHRGEGWIPSFATETGLLFPTERGTEKARGADFEGTAIFSWFLPALTWHMTLGGATHHAKQEEPADTKARFIFGTIVDVPIHAHGEEGVHLVAEYSGEKVEKEALEHQLLGGVVWHSPWAADFDAAGFGGLSTESTDWGITIGVTVSTQLIRRRRREAGP